MLRSKLREISAFGLAGGVVFVDSVGRVMSMVGDLVLVSILLAVTLTGRSKSKKEDC